MTTLMEHYVKCKNNKDDITKLLVTLKVELQSYEDDEQALRKDLERECICYSKVPYVVDNYLPVMEDIIEYHLANFISKYFFSNTIKRLHDKIGPRVFHKIPNYGCIKKLEDYATVTRLKKRAEEDLNSFERRYKHLIDYSRIENKNK